MKIEISISKFMKILLYSIIVLCFGNLISIELKLKYHLNDMNTVVRLFNFDTEQSFSSLFSFLIILTCSILLFLIFKLSANSRKLSYEWLVLSIIFLFLSLDELLSFHELLNLVLNRKLMEIGNNPWLWTIPYVLLFIGVSIYILPLIRIIPKRIVLLFLISATMYLIGAVGFEFFGGSLTIINNYEFDQKYNLIYSIEETLEMLGITLFNYSLLRYITELEANFILIKFEKHNNKNNYQ